MRRIAHSLLFTTITTTTTILLLVGSPAVRAQTCVGAHCDVLVARLMIPGEDCGAAVFDASQTVEYSRLVTGARDFGTFPVGTLYPVRAFDERLDGSFAADDPGFAAVPAPCNDVPSLAPLPPARGLYVDFLTELHTGPGPERNLLYWDGIDDDTNGLDENDVEWSPVPLDEILRIDELGATAVADGGTSEVEGIFIDSTGASGNIHDHIDFELRRSGGGLASIGVYLVRLDLTMPGFAEGAPVHMVFATVSTPAGAEVVARSQVESELVFPLCDDGVDNDRDGLTDFPDDPGCDSATDDSEKSTAHECDDGIDNDGDGLIDYRAVDFGAAGLYADRDPECDMPEAIEVPEPSVALLLASGVTGLVLLGHRRSRISARRA